MDAPGAVLTTSTKLDLAGGMHDARSFDELGHPRAVHFLNLTRFGGRESTVRWSVLDGCGDYATAMRRTEALIPRTEDEKAERWDGPARPILAILMRAAALGGYRMQDVQRWLNAAPGSQDSQEPMEVLARTPNGLAQVSFLSGHYRLNGDTRTSINSSVTRGLQWLSDDAASELGDAEGGIFDIAGFIDRRETLHIIGKNDRTDLAPLMTCVVMEIAHVALQKAGRSPGGRLDPPMTMILDEAAKTCPVPLPSWTSDFEGQGITLHILVQSIPQLIARWGDTGAGTILTNTTYITFGGSKDSASVKGIVDVLGERREKLIDRDGKKDIEAFEWRHRPVQTAADLNRIPMFEVVVLRSGMGMVKGHSPQPWKRRGWKMVELEVPEFQAEGLEELTEEIPVVRPIPVMARVAAFARRLADHRALQREVEEGAS